MALGSSTSFKATGTVSVAATTTPAVVPLAGVGNSVIIANTATSPAFIRFAPDKAVVATPNDTTVLPNSKAMVSVDPLTLFVSVVLSSGVGTMFFSRGNGPVG